jgi:hypothetical protein
MRSNGLNSKMNKSKLVLIVSLIGISFFLTACTLLPKKTATVGNETTQKDTVSKEADTPEQNLGEVVTSKFADILKLGKNMHCTANIVSSGNTVYVETYVSGTKFRTDSSGTLADGSEMKVYMISDGEWAYMWSDQSTQGMKMKYSEFSNTAENVPQAAKTAAKYDIRKEMEKYDFDCKPWLLVDQSKFEVPTDVTFQDLSVMMEQLKGMNKQLCAKCNTLPAEQKQACLTSLKCTE